MACLNKTPLKVVKYYSVLGLLFFFLVFFLYRYMYFLGEWATEIYKRMVMMVELTSFCHSGSVRNCFIEYSSVLTFVQKWKTRLWSNQEVMGLCQYAQVK